MTSATLKILWWLWGILTLVSIAATIYLLTIDWRVAIPLGCIAAIFGFMTVRDIIRAVKKD